ncbi:unnamed protein product, partial [Didymodactylos carnosus]
TDNQQLMLDIFTLIAFDYDFGSLNNLLSIISRKSATLINIEDKPELSDLKTNLNDKAINLVASLVSSLHKDEVAEMLKREEVKIGFTKQELLDEVLSLLLAGYETTSSTISWFIYYVHKNPEAEQKMKEELKRHGITKETSLDYDNLLQKCEYIDCVINETLKIAPLAVGSFQTLIKGAVVDGVKLRRGETVLSAFSLMQSDPRNWKLDPTQFIPERFYGIDAPDRNHHSFAFMPFGGGNRTCAGQDAACLELKVIVTRLMQFVTFIDAPGKDDGHCQRMIIMPKELAVSIKFD